MARPYPEVGGDDVLVGSVVADRYHVAGILGQGTTGTVFGVEHIHFGRRAAMKVLRPRSTATDVVHRVFHGDARAAWSVNHACLADVFDVGTLPDGAPFFVSEYLEGETLGKRMARDRLSLAASVDVMMQVLSAIAAVHERALLVRDLRPQNVFLAHRRGCRPIAKLLDLGLGRLTPLEAVAEQWDADPKAASVSYPHPFYLSPERTRSEHGIDFASDLFVAGVIFYEMLTGSKPFSASTYNGLLLQIAQASPTPVSELRDHSLPELDDFVEHALSGNPRNRFSSAKEMQDELRRIFEGKKKGASAAPMTISSQTVQAVNAAAPAPPSGTGPTAVPMMGMMPSMAPAAQSLAGIAAPPSVHASPLAPPAPPSRHSPMGPGSPQHGHPSNRFPAAVSSVSPLASLLEPEPSPRDRTLATDVPTKTNTDLPIDMDGDLYADETETDRKFFDVSPYRDPASSSRMQAASSRRPSPSAPMPASEDGEDPKTMPPTQAMELAQPPTVQAFKPMKIGSADDFEEPTESRNALSDEMLRSIREGNKTPLPPVPEEETQQLEMTPELRAKIEAQYAARPIPPAPVRAPMSSEMDSIPPPTKRLDK
jgi:eukaryotic-like serine/threonine-protein kinase